MMKTPLSRLAMLVVALPILGCAGAQEGHLYRHDVPAVSRFFVASSAATTTNVKAQLADGTTCEGRLARTGTSTLASSADEARDLGGESDTAVAILVCRSTAVIRCRLVHRVVDGYAFGHCEDEHGASYTVIF